MMQDKLASILVIEDNPSNLSVLFNLLNEGGFEVLVSLDGEGALQIASESRPDLILLDVMLTGIDGFETCRRLKSSRATHDIPVIFMTAMTSTADKVRGFNLGAVDYITKPFEPEEVLSRVKIHLLIRQLQNDLQTKNADLLASLDRERELNKLKSRFISIASHEFRTPLSAIRFSNNLLKRYTQVISEKDVAQDMVEELESIDTALRQMTDTLEEVLTLSKSEAGQFPFFPLQLDLFELCHGIVERFRLLANEKHDIVYASDTKELPACVDPKLIENILSNLLSNAIKYSPEGGTVTVHLAQEDGQALLSVEDQGIGISEEDCQRLFEAFYRASNTKEIKGTGLGLSIVKQFVELHDGAIHVESALHKGSRFVVSLPLQNKQAAEKLSIDEK